VNRLTAGVDPEQEGGVPALGDRHRGHPGRGPFGIAGQHGVWPYPLGDPGEGSAEIGAPDLFRAFPDDVRTITGPRDQSGVWSVPLVCGVTEEQIQVLNHSDAGCLPECQSCTIRFSVQGRPLQQ